MDNRCEIPLMTADTRVVQALKEALRDDTRFAANRSCSGCHDLAAQLRETSAPAALIDLDSDPAALSELESLTTRWPSTRFIILANAADPPLMLRAMQAGARHLLLKQDIARELRSTLHKLAPPRQDAGGAVITVISAAGGAGATTIAINLAVELNRKLQKQALLVDLDWAYAGLTSYLGLCPQYGLADVLNHQRIDPELIRSSASTSGDDLSVLATRTTSPARDASRGLERMNDVLMACRSAFGISVVDASRLEAQTLATLARSSVWTLIILQANVKDVRSARAIRDELIAHGADGSRVKFVVNRWQGRWQMLTLEDIQKTLGQQVHVLVNDFAAAVKALNFGRPLGEIAPRCRLSRDIAQLAENLGQDCETFVQAVAAA